MCYVCLKVGRVSAVRTIHFSCSQASRHTFSFFRPGIRVTAGAPTEALVSTVASSCRQLVAGGSVGTGEAKHGMSTPVALRASSDLQQCQTILMSSCELTVGPCI